MDMQVDGIISAIVIGAVLGILGRMIRPGKQDIPIWLTIAVGIVAALIGTLIARLLNVGDTEGVDWIELVLQLVLAVVGVGVAAGVYTGRKGVGR